MHNTPQLPASSPARRSSSRWRFSRVVLPLAVGALALAACDIEVDFDEDEDRVEQSFDLGSFDGITVDAPFDVTIRQGEIQSISVEVGESLADDLVVEVIDGELLIDLDSSSFNIGRHLSATITVTDLDSLHASSASDVVVVGLDADFLDVRADEASQVSMSGSIDTLDLDMSEASSADLHGTTIGTVTLELSGASSADFPATVETISGSISDASSLEVDNETIVRVDTSGFSSIDTD